MDEFLSELNKLEMNVHGVSDRMAVVIKRPPDMTEEELTEQLRRMAHDFLMTLGVSVIMIAVDDLEDIALLDEQEMEEVGWIRKERALMLKSDKLHAGVNIEEEE